jgi:hypothetical protein
VSVGSGRSVSAAAIAEHMFITFGNFIR